MLSRNRITLLLMVAGIVTAILPVLLVAKDWKPTEAYRETVNRIEALSKIRGLSSQKKLERLGKLEKLGQEIEKKWRATDVETYALLTYKVSATLGSLDFRTPRCHYLARSFAMRALEKADKFPLHVECQLLGYVQQRSDAKGNTLKGKAWAVLRKKQANLWLHAWQRIEKTIDKNWDPKDLPSINVMLPPGVSGVAGMSPKHIKDPKLRAQYEAAIAANKKKNEEYGRQYRARRLKKYRIPRAERFIIRAYMEPPTGKAELKELEALLQQYIPDAGKRTRILKAVENKKMPDDLILRRITTHPAKPKSTTQPAEGKSTTQPSEAK